ncbi:hypothetical protein [Saccharicrinis sp. 156]|uniref:hypothetical protein n=1 Tax=Saccharicrinis sp. 156 TaxID=3417574 RepID=UPI003D353301
MKVEQNKKAIDETLEQICSHALFIHSNTHTRLLRYLVEKAILGEDLKEYTIGSDLFGIDYSIDKNNGTVRSYMYKLRKKVAAYYESAKPINDIVFHLEKGQYNLSFLSSKEYQSSINKEESYFKISKQKLLTATLSVAGSLLLFFIILHFSRKPNILWEPYFIKGANNLIVVSDQFTVTQKLEDGLRHAVLYGDINNNKDLLNYNQKHPDIHLKNTDYTIMSKMAPYGIKILTEWFISNQSSYNLQLESNLTYDDVRENNILFIGQYKTMNISNSLFLKNSKMFSTYRDGFKYANNNEEKIYNTRFKENGKLEYAMVSYKPIESGKMAFYFVSNNDIGVLATLRKFTDKDWLKGFEKQLPKNSKTFNALFEVSGLQRTDVSCELVELETFNN